MFNIFEQPWTLVGVAVIALFVVFTIRSVWPEKRKPWQLAIPLLIAALGFGIDALVMTDLEKVNKALKDIMLAASNDDPDAIGALLTEDYSDSYHSSKSQLISRCRDRFAEPLISKIKITGDLIEMATTTATATIFGVAHFEPESFVARDYRDFVYFKARFRLEKQADGNWLFNNIELIEIDKQPFNWSSWR